MNNYIRERLRADAAKLAAASAVEARTPHHGLRGRFRELLVQEILAPWLPAYARCGTGMIVDHSDRRRDHSQDDIIVFDQSLVPPVLVGHDAVEGVFPFDGVLARIEVKSTLDANALRSSLEAAAEIRLMTFATAIEGRIWPHPISMLFAYGSDLAVDGPNDAEWQRLLRITKELDFHFSGPCHDVPSPLAGLCVLGRGAWAWGKRQTQTDHCWMMATRAAEYDEVLFVGLLSNTCYEIHAQRLGLDPDAGVAGGIGRYIMTGDSFLEDRPEP